MNRPAPLLPISTRWVAVFCVSLMILSGCSSTRTAYRYADWGVIWWVEDYVSLTDAQERKLTRDIDQLRQWHCSNELPKYQQWLDGLQSDVQQRNLGPDIVAFHQEQLLDLFPPLLARITPIATDLLASLTEAQVRELADNMKERQRELEEEFLMDDPESTAAARAERTEERVERWLGELNDRQRAIVATWSAQREQQTEIWLQGRQNWQTALLDTLERRHKPGFVKDVERLIRNSEEIRGKEYKAMMADSRGALKTLMHDLVMAGNTAQLAHLENRAAELNSDFAALTCSPSSSVAVSNTD